MDWLHLGLSARGRVTWFSDEAVAREARCRILAFLGDQAGLFGFVDDHAHLVVGAERDRWPVIAGTVRRSLQRIVGPAQPPHLQPVESRSHLEHLVGYVPRQAAKHGLREHPALHSGSCVANLVGARRTPGFRPQTLWGWLPRWRARHVLERVGLDDPGHASPDEVAALPLGELVDIAHDAFDTDGVGRSASALAARRSAAHLALAGGTRRVDIADALGLTRQRLTTLVREVAPPEELLIVRRRVALVRAVRESR